MRQIVSLLCLFVIGLCIIPFAAAQDEVQAVPDDLHSAVRFTHLISDMVPAQNSIKAIVQDNQGFMWIGTLGGLSRDDGYTFKTYLNDNTNPNSLSENYIRDLYVDRDGMLWIATEGGGVDKLDPDSETYTRYVPDPDNPNSICR